MGRAVPALARDLMVPLLDATEPSQLAPAIERLLDRTEVDGGPGAREATSWSKIEVRPMRALTATVSFGRG